MQKAAVITLGCPKNTVEAEYVLGILNKKGYGITADIHDADVILIHTCSFINDARIESENAVNAVLDIKKHKDIKVYVSGCLPQLLKNNTSLKFPGIDGFLGTGSLYKLPKMISGGKVTGILNPGGLNDSRYRILSSPLPGAYLKIAEGCNHRCSFCIIPQLRGKYVSRPLKSLVDEASGLAAAGIKELIIVAQDTTTYGLDLYDKFSLDKLLSSLAKIKGFKWIRLLYAYPSSITDGLIEVLKEYKNICKYIDIPVQHAGKNVLSLMKRPVNTVKIIEKMALSLPEGVLRTSIITGFPGESGKDFKELLAFIERGYFQYVGVFEYSDQKNAASSKLKKHVGSKTASERRKIIEKKQYEVFISKAKKFNGAVTEFFAERCVKKGKMYEISGRCWFQAPEIDGNTVVLSKRPMQAGKFYKVKIGAVNGYNFNAELII